MTSPNLQRAVCALLLLVFAAVVLFSGCDPSRRVQFSGKTMGTIYRITLIAPFFADTGHIQKKVEQRLKTLNHRLSTYIKDSEINRFNNIKHAGQPFRTSADLAAMLRLGKRLHDLTDGAWDGTVWPLVKLWQFDQPGIQKQPPAAAAIDKTLDCVGFSHIVLSSDGTAAKKRPCVSLGFGSIAKGYGVDQLTELLKKLGFDDFIVEIGGEVYAAGTKNNHKKWRVGVNMPKAGAPADRVRRTISLSDRAIATSGDYRNFFTMDGKTYSHVLDPRTGYPVRTGVVSTSVTADSCALADGLATALMVMKVKKGLKRINSLEETECLITVRTADGKLKDYCSDNF